MKRCDGGFMHTCDQPVTLTERVYVGFAGWVVIDHCDKHRWGPVKEPQCVCFVGAPCPVHPSLEHAT